MLCGSTLGGSTSGTAEHLAPKPHLPDQNEGLPLWPAVMGPRLACRQEASDLPDYVHHSDFFEILVTVCWLPDINRA